MAKRLELVGNVFGKLTVVSKADKRHGHIYWLCKCECGNETVTRGASIVAGDVTSCGCTLAEIARAQLNAIHFSRKELGTPHPAKTHGMSGSDTYSIYRGMLNRCHSPAYPSYEHYGEKGITVCDKWRESFENFLADMGIRPSKEMSLERKDGKQGYTPENTVWATDEQQARNRSMLKSNKTGKTGVTFNRHTQYWIAHGTDPVTKRNMSKSFSFNKYGEDGFRLACLERDRMIAEFNAKGANYSDTHGL